MLYKVLTDIGLSEKESIIYLTLLELGTASAFEISKKNKIPSATIYANLNNLEQKGLVTKFEQNKTTKFFSLRPNALFHYLEKKKKDINEKQKELEHAFSELSAIHLLSQKRSRLRLYEGKDSLTLLEQDADEEYDRLKTSIVYAFTPLDLISEFDKNKQIADRRIQRGLKLKQIYTHKDGVKNNSNPYQLRESRFLPREKFPFDAAVVITPNHSVKLFSYKKSFVGIWIDNKDIANTLKTIFDICWQSAQKEK